MILQILALIDIHTLFVYVFHEHLPAIYILSGAGFVFGKGLIFFMGSKDIFSLIDMCIGVLTLFFLAGGLWGFLFWGVFIYLVYKIILSFASF